MFAERLRRFSYPIGVRIAMFQALLFVLSVSLLFFAAYWILSAYLTKKDHELIQSKLSALSAHYEKGGLPELNEALSSAGAAEEAWIFARLETPDGKVPVLQIPKDSESFSLKSLEGTVKTQKPSAEWRRLEKESDENVLEVLSVRQKDGSLLQIGRNSDDREAEIDLVQNVFLALSIPIVLLGIFGGYLLSSRILKPIRGMIETIRGFTQGDLSVRLTEPKSNDELSELSQAFNHTADRVQSLLEGMRRTVDDIAHDLRTPLTRFKSSAERALQSPGDLEYYRESLLECVDASERILTLVDSVMDIAVTKSGTLKLELERIVLKPLVSDLLDLYGAVAEDAGIRLINRVPESLELYGDSTHIARALGNLIDNAIKYGKSGGEVRIEANFEGGMVSIHVSDTGIGIPRDELPRIWTRLYRVDRSRSRKGLGLGLTLVKAIAEAHRGEVGVQSTLDQGSTFSLRLPSY